MVYLVRVLYENGFYAYSGSTEGAFYSESSLKRSFCTKDTFIRWMVSTAERQKTATLTKRMVVERTISTQRTVVEEHGFNTGGGGKEGMILYSCAYLNV